MFHDRCTIQDLNLLTHSVTSIMPAGLESRLSCAVCGRLLPFVGDPNNRLFSTIFPDMAFAFLVHLAYGPGSIPCAACRNNNKLGFSQIVVGPSGGAILYLADGSDEVNIRKLLHAHLKTTSDLTVVRDDRTFRRAFLQTFVVQHVQLLNELSLSETDLFSWVKHNESRLDKSFFTALWLLESGVVPTFTRSSEDTPTTGGFIPHEEATTNELHVNSQRNARQVLSKQTGEILGWLFVLWAQRSLEARSFNAFRDVVSRLLPKEVIYSDLMRHAAQTLGKLAEHFKIGERGAIAGRYSFETMLALLHARYHVPNPRRPEWTAILLQYEFERRLDGNDESLLLEPELLRAEIDTDVFWKGVHAIGHANFRKVNEQTSKGIIHLAETVERIYPNLGSSLLKLEILPNSAGTDEEVRAAFQEMMAVAFDNESSEYAQGFLEAQLRGILRWRPQLLVDAISLVNDRAALEWSPERQVKLKRFLVEVLNLSHNYKMARQVADEALALLNGSVEISPYEHASLLNEVGNCFRYSGDFSLALAKYDSALALVQDVSDETETYVLRRNRAIVLRDLHRYDEARAVFAWLRDRTQDNARLGNVVSEAICLIKTGQHDEAYELIEEYETLALGRSLLEREQLEYWSLRSQLLANHGQIQEAREAAHRVAEAAKQLNDPVSLAAVVTLLLDTADAKMPNEKRIEILTEVIELSRSALASIADAPGMADAALGCTERLYKALLACGDTMEAIKFLREMLDLITPDQTPRAWLLWTWLYELALDRRDAQGAAEALIHSLAALSFSVAQVTNSSDVKTLLAPYATKLEKLIQDAIVISQSSPEEADWLGTLSADILTAPILSAKLRASAGLEAALFDIEAEKKRFTDLLNETPARLIQVVRIKEGIAVLSMSLDRHGDISRSVHFIELDWPVVAATLRRLSFRLRSVSPKTTRLKVELENVRGWSELNATLTSILNKYGDGEPLCIAPGPIPTAAYTLSAQINQTLCFVPSMAALVALRIRRRALEGGLNWRPRSLFDFAVWRFGDKESVAEALRATVDDGAALAARHGLKYSGCPGEKADSEALMQGLGSAELARIACHGRLLQDEEAVDLLVAADGLLPPANSVALASNVASGHILAWRDLESCKRISPIVVSSACDSGTAIHHPGGERLGLERPLLAAGTIAFVAPQWPVPASPMQPFTTNFIDTYLSDPSISLAEVLCTVRNRALKDDVPPLAAEALAVFGDGL